MVHRSRGRRQEARSKRNYLLFFGVPEQAEDCPRIIEDIIKNKLGLIGRDTKIQRAHRLGKKMNNNIGHQRSRPRPIIVAFLDYRDREAVRSARSKLRIGEDYPMPVRRARESLSEELKAIKNSGKRATIAYPARLIVEGRPVKSVDVVDMAAPQSVPRHS